MDNALTGFLGAIAALVVVAFVYVIWQKGAEFIRVLNRGAIASAQVSESLNKHADTFASMEKLLAGQIRISEAQVEVTVKLEKAIVSLIKLVRAGDPQPIHGPNGSSLIPDPDDASREYELQLLERRGLSREEAVDILDGQEPDGSDGLYAAIRGGLSN